MFSLIGNVLKYSAIVIGVLVLSHVIQVRGVSISKHVENTLDWFGGGARRDIVRVTRSLSSAVREPEIDSSDRKELNRIILRSQQK